MHFHDESCGHEHHKQGENEASGNVASDAIRSKKIELFASLNKNKSLDESKKEILKAFEAIDKEGLNKEKDILHHKLPDEYKDKLMKKKEAIIEGFKDGFRKTVDILSKSTNEVDEIIDAYNKEHNNEYNKALETAATLYNSDLKNTVLIKAEDLKKMDVIKHAVANDSSPNFTTLNKLRLIQILISRHNIDANKIEKYIDSTFHIYETFASACFQYYEKLGMTIKMEDILTEIENSSNFIILTTISHGDHSANEIELSAPYKNDSNPLIANFANNVLLAAGAKEVLTLHGHDHTTEKKVDFYNFNEKVFTKNNKKLVKQQKQALFATQNIDSKLSIEKKVKNLFVKTNERDLAFFVKKFENKVDAAIKKEATALSENLLQAALSKTWKTLTPEEKISFSNAEFIKQCVALKINRINANPAILNKVDEMKGFYISKLNAATQQGLIDKINKIINIDNLNIEAIKLNKDLTSDEKTQLMTAIYEANFEELHIASEGIYKTAITDGYSKTKEYEEKSTQIEAEQDEHIKKDLNRNLNNAIDAKFKQACNNIALNPLEIIQVATTTQKLTELFKKLPDDLQKYDPFTKHIANQKKMRVFVDKHLPEFFKTIEALCGDDKKKYYEELKAFYNEAIKNPANILKIKPDGTLGVKDEFNYLNGRRPIKQMQMLDSNQVKELFSPEVIKNIGIIKYEEIIEKLPYIETKDLQTLRQNIDTALKEAEAEKSKFEKEYAKTEAHKIDGEIKKIQDEINTKKKEIKTIKTLTTRLKDSDVAPETQEQLDTKIDEINKGIKVKFTQKKNELLQNQPLTKEESVLASIDFDKVPYGPEQQTVFENFLAEQCTEEQKQITILKNASEDTNLANEIEKLEKELADLKNKPKPYLADLNKKELEIEQKNKARTETKNYKLLEKYSNEIKANNEKKFKKQKELQFNEKSIEKQRILQKEALLKKVAESIKYQQIEEAVAEKIKAKFRSEKVGKSENKVEELIASLNNADALKNAANGAMSHEGDNIFSKLFHRHNSDQLPTKADIEKITDEKTRTEALKELDSAEVQSKNFLKYLLLGAGLGFTALLGFGGVFAIGFVIAGGIASVLAAIAMYLANKTSNGVVANKESNTTMAFSISMYAFMGLAMFAVLFLVGWLFGFGAPAIILAFMVPVLVGVIGTGIFLFNTRSKNGQLTPEIIDKKKEAYLSLVPIVGIYLAYKDKQQYETKKESDDFINANKRFNSAMISTIAALAIIGLVLTFFFLSSTGVLVPFKLLLAIASVGGASALLGTSLAAFLGFAPAKTQKLDGLLNNIIPKEPEKQKEMNKALNNDLEIFGKTYKYDKKVIQSMQMAHPVVKVCFLKLEKIIQTLGGGTKSGDLANPAKAKKIVDDLRQSAIAFIEQQYSMDKINQATENDKAAYSQIVEHYTLIEALKLSMSRPDAEAMLREYKNYAMKDPTQTFLIRISYNNQNSGEFALLHNFITNVSNAIKQTSSSAPENKASLAIYGADVLFYRANEQFIAEDDYNPTTQVTPTTLWEDVSQIWKNMKDTWAQFFFLKSKDDEEKEKKTSAWLKVGRMIARFMMLMAIVGFILSFLYAASPWLMGLAIAGLAGWLILKPILSVVLGNKIGRTISMLFSKCKYELVNMAIVITAIVAIFTMSPTGLMVLSFVLGAALLVNMIVKGFSRSDAIREGKDERESKGKIKSLMLVIAQGCGLMLALSQFALIPLALGPIPMAVLGVVIAIIVGFEIIRAYWPAITPTHTDSLNDIGKTNAAIANGFQQVKRVNPLREKMIGTLNLTSPSYEKQKQNIDDICDLITIQAAKEKTIEKQGSLAILPQHYDERTHCVTNREDVVYGGQQKQSNDSPVSSRIDYINNFGEKNIPLLDWEEQPDPINEKSGGHIISERILQTIGGP